MKLDQFLTLSKSEVRALVQENGPQTCAFAFNGTRRWFLLEHPHRGQNFEAYVEALSNRVIEIAKIFFDFGINTLVFPVISPHVFEGRDADYKAKAIQALNRIAIHPSYQAFYDSYQINAHIYGDYDKHLPLEVVPGLTQDYINLSLSTAEYSQRQIFWGICAHDAEETISELSIAYYNRTGRTPSKRNLINMYYGAAVQPIDLYIGSGKPQVIDVPLLSTGRESLYFSMTPSPYFDEYQLRTILFDHIFQRSTDAGRYMASGQQNLQTLRQFYRDNHSSIVGLGVRNDRWEIWHSIPLSRP